MAHLNEFVGVIPYSMFDDEPVALIWKHTYTSPLTRANDNLFSEMIIRKADENETSADAISRVLSKATATAATTR